MGRASQPLGFRFPVWGTAYSLLGTESKLAWRQEATKAINSSINSPEIASEKVRI